jgi:F-type H+-transporting ATPase subunit gamma
MATMRDIRRRIKTVRNIQQITKALKMVSAARLQRAQSRAAAARPYADEMLAVMRHLASVGGEVRHPLLEVRQPESIGVLMITSDRGMAGSYNTNIIRRVSEIVRPYGAERIKLITVGKKGRAFFARRGYASVAEFAMPTAEATIADARAISRTVREMFESEQIDVLHLVYTRFVSAITQRVTDMQLLPIIPPEAKEIGIAEDFEFEPPPELLLGSLLPRYVDTQVYRAMLESLASEHGARMTAMSSATDNAREMIDRLTLDLNRARQAAITRELAEIVGGASALA